MNTETRTVGRPVNHKQGGWTLRRVRDHLWGPSGSIALHVLVLFLLVRFATVRTQPEYIPVGDIILDPVSAPPDWDPEPRDPLPDRPADVADLPLMSPDERVPPAPADVAGDPPPDEDMGIDLLDSASPAKLTGLIAGLRDRSGPGRQRHTRSFNPDSGPAGEQCVLRALEWLKAHQRADGAWTGTGRAAGATAMTGLALLTFLAHGETVQSERYGTTVESAIRFLLGTQAADGRFDADAYANGIALYAVSEAYALTRIPQLRLAMEQGVARVLAGQQDTGAFTYGYARDGRRDTSVAGWQVQALKAAHVAGADVPGLREALDRCAEAMRMNSREADGRFAYAPEPGGGAGEPTTACTGIGTLSLQLLGHGGSAAAEGGARALRDVRCDWVQPGVGRWPMYAWYYIAQVKFHGPRSRWTEWVRGFAPEMVRHQNADGSWLAEGDEEKAYGPVYATTLTALSLMVHYRTLLSYQPIPAGTASPGPGARDDVVVGFDGA